MVHLTRDLGWTARPGMARLALISLAAATLASSFDSSAGSPIAYSAGERSAVTTNAPSEPQDPKPILGTSLSILADGTAPWEDRPIVIPGFGTIPGTPGASDPGDDASAFNQVVRSWDVVMYTLAFSVRDAGVDEVVAEATLTGPAEWESRQLGVLEFAGCPGGATLHDGGKRLRCVTGKVDAPPAVTVALDLTARVLGEGLQGDVITAAATVRAAGVVPDPERGRCPIPRIDGCDANAPDVTVSAAPAAELRKNLVQVTTEQVGGVAGRRLQWRLDAVLGADGDARGTSNPVGAPWVLADWWEARVRGSRVLDLPVRLLSCTDVDEGASWSCAQPGGDGGPIEVTLEELDLAAVMPKGPSAAKALVAGSLLVDLWVPEDEVRSGGWDVAFENCFATEVGTPAHTVWSPTDARGVPNLGGLAEPAFNNCAQVVLPVPRPRGGGGGGGGRPGSPIPGPGPDPGSGPPPPDAVMSKRYTPRGFGDFITEGTEFAADVSVTVTGGHRVHDVIACDKWDSGTQALRDGGFDGVRVWWRDGTYETHAMDPSGVVVEYGRGPWGRGQPEHIGTGRRWYVQAVSTCADDVAISPPGWVAAEHVDFTNQGGGAINARDVNMVRVHFLDTLSTGHEVWMEVLLQAGRNPNRSWLMNYGAAFWDGGGRYWHRDDCYGAEGTGTVASCPRPAPGTRGRPGPLGDMLAQLGVPVWVEKRNDPVEPEGSPIVAAGDTADFTLHVSTHPKPDEPPLPEFPPGALAMTVVLTDTLPSGMTYETASATIESEDINGNGALDPGEDTNGNGVIDADVPFEPTVSMDPLGGTTNMVWRLGDLPYMTQVPTIRYSARVSRLVPAGTSLTNWAITTALGDPPGECYPRPWPPRRDWPDGRYQPTDVRDRPYDDRVQQGEVFVPQDACTWAQVVVANSASAQIEKVPRWRIVAPGEAMVFRLGFGNLSTRSVEWFDAVDLLPRAAEPRDPETRIGGGVNDIAVSASPAYPALEVWASATDPAVIDTAGGGMLDGLVDPVAAWGDGGAGLGGPMWPCLFAEVGTSRCREIGSRADVSALRLWGPDPDPDDSGQAWSSFLPVDAAPRYVDVTLHVPESRPGDLAHNAWGGRFQGLPLAVFDSAVIRVPPAATATPVPSVTTKPSPPATPTDLATATATATETPVATGTPAAPATPSRPPTSTVEPDFACYLPVVLDLPCEPRPVDVALVIDASTSMLRSAGDGGTKQDAVMRAARAFLDRFAMGSSGGRVAVVAFNVAPHLIQPLTADRAAVERALDALPVHVAEGTRLDLGLLAGADVLGDPAADRWRAMVFLTDGMPNWVPTPVGGGSQEDTVLAAARAVRERGIVVHTVGYGRADAADPADRISPELLRAIAGADGAYHETDDAGALADVFRRIAEELGCRRPFRLANGDDREAVE